MPGPLDGNCSIGCSRAGLPAPGIGDLRANPILG